MKKDLGIWIDHREAVLVSLIDDQASVERIKSNAESHFRHSGGWKAGGSAVAQSIAKEQKADERRKHQFHSFYQLIIEKAMGAGRLVIFGPAEAKQELTKELERNKNWRGRIVKVTTADKMTEHQIVEKTKSAFPPQESRIPR